MQSVIDKLRIPCNAGGRSVLKCTNRCRGSLGVMTSHWMYFCHHLRGSRSVRFTAMAFVPYFYERKQDMSLRQKYTVSSDSQQWLDLQFACDQI